MAEVSKDVTTEQPSTMQLRLASHAGRPQSIGRALVC